VEAGLWRSPKASLLFSTKRPTTELRRELELGAVTERVVVSGALGVRSELVEKVRDRDKGFCRSAVRRSDSDCRAVLVLSDTPGPDGVDTAEPRDSCVPI
jgi:hypothetical protein